jgi:hypothetical protein
MIEVPADDLLFHETLLNAPAASNSSGCAACAVQSYRHAPTSTHSWMNLQPAHCMRCLSCKLKPRWMLYGRRGTHRACLVVAGRCELCSDLPWMFGQQLVEHLPTAYCTYMCAHLLVLRSSMISRFNYLRPPHGLPWRGWHLTGQFSYFARMLCLLGSCSSNTMYCTVVDVNGVLQETFLLKDNTAALHKLRVAAATNNCQ